MAKKASYFKMQQYVRILDTYSRTNRSPASQLPILKAALTGISMSAASMENDFVYRSRWNVLDRLFTNTSELKYVPKNEVRKKGRLNDVGESILYAAACELGTIMESRPQLYKPFTICKIAVNRKGLLFAPIGMIDKQHGYGTLSPSEKLITDYCNREIPKVVQSPEEAGRRMEKDGILKFPLAKVFSQKNDGITSFLRELRNYTLPKAA